MNLLFKYLHHRFFDSGARWYPFLAVYYLTYNCDFRCPYCSNGFNLPYHQLSPEVSPHDTVLEILKRIRRHCDYLVITGGEPLKHPDARRVLDNLGAAGFRTVALNTNGYEADQYLPEIARNIDTLIFSLDTMNAAKADSWFGNGSGTFDRILSNIEAASSYPGRGYEIIISAVATPDNIDDLYDVYEYAQSRGFTFAVCPELQGVRPPAALTGNGDYVSFYDFLIKEKWKGRSIFGSPGYLQHMRDFAKFDCRPFTLLVVDPLGRVYYPCLEIGHQAGDILACDDLHMLRRKAEERFGPRPDCGAQCHSACALGLSLAVGKPASIIQEAAIRLKKYF